jgi:uncharacterized membrane protein YczE
MTTTVDMPRASRWRATPKQLVRLLVGLWIFGTGGALLVAAELGTEPWTVLAQGVATRTPLSIGVATQLIGVVVLAAWIPLRERPGLGTVLNIIVIGLAIDVMLPLLPQPQTLIPRLAAVLAGVAMVGIGSGFYLTAALGPGPRDGWMTGMHERFGWPLHRVRFGIEISVLVAGWLLGGTVGIGTVVFALLIGPAVALALRLLGGRSDQPVTAAPPGE